jgi:hypothetical protein
MKKISFILISFLSFSFCFSQKEKYESLMTSKIVELDSTLLPARLQELSNTFERIGNIEKKEWLPYYYAALSLIRKGQVSKSTQDELGEKAEQLVVIAEQLSPKNDELFILRKMIANLRMSVDPMNRYMIYGPVAVEAMNKAKTINPKNPRIYLLEGEDLYYTPEQFGGNKNTARKVFDHALTLFSAINPANNLVPQWGLKDVKSYLRMYNSDNGEN